MHSSLLAVGVAFLATVGLVAQTGQQERIYKPGEGATDPVLVSRVPPKYTPEALQAGLQGVIELQAVVRPDGTVGDVTVVKSLDRTYGLDDRAVEAARQWRFKPGQINDRPVPVLITLVMEFRQQGGRQETEDEFAKGAVRADAPGLVAPKAVKTVAPRYTSDAMRAKIQGTVVLEVVVLEDGTVGRTRIREPLDDQYGLDASALEAAAQWEFEPGTLDGKPVAVLMELRLQFRLHE